MRARRLAVMCLLSLPAAVLGQQESQPGFSAEGSARPVLRSWLFNEDAQMPAARQGVVLSRLTWSSQASRAARPFAANLGSPGPMVEVGGELGIGASLSLQAIGMQGVSYQTDSAATGAQIGFRWEPMAGR